jgi:alanine racemase
MDPLSHRRCWVEVDGQSLRHNVRLLRSLVPRRTKLMAVVKANAYGHGLVPMARELEAIGTDWLGVANVAEGEMIRAAGVQLPILLLSATLPEEMAAAIRQRLTLTLSSLEEARRLDRLGRRLRLKASVHFKIDTGMGRLGCWHKNARRELAAIRALSHLRVEGLCTHFASADDNAGLTQEQWNVISPFFEENAELLRHAANSPAVTRRYGFSADMVRVGLALYGIAPNPEDQDLGLRPLLAWKSRVTLLHEMNRGRTVSYGATYRVPSRQRQAVIAMGYGDGYFRLHSNSSHLLVRGQRCPIRGRVTMDQIMIDVTRVPGVRIGDEVVALGRQGDEEIRARELAMQAHTIPWEILTNIGSRVPRVYVRFRTRNLKNRNFVYTAS